MFLEFYSHHHHHRNHSSSAVYKVGLTFTRSSVKRQASNAYPFATLESQLTWLSLDIYRSVTQETISVGKRIIGYLHLPFGFLAFTRLLRCDSEIVWVKVVRGVY